MARRAPYERAPWEDTIANWNGDTDGDRNEDTNGDRNEDTDGDRNASKELAKHMREVLKAVKKTAQDRWKDRWTNGTTGAHLRALMQAPNKLVRKLYAKRRKAASSPLVQLRTGKIGFNDFLYSRGVPQIRSRRCTCGMGDRHDGEMHHPSMPELGRRTPYLSRYGRPKSQDDPQHS